MSKFILFSVAVIFLLLSIDNVEAQTTTIERKTLPGPPAVLNLKTNEVKCTKEPGTCIILVKETTTNLIELNAFTSGGTINLLIEDYRIIQNQDGTESVFYQIPYNAKLEEKENTSQTIQTKAE
ncbi:MAG: hypothetical protein JJT94_02820 [Bernardetiaceae bacterium]|nr:hypothetical protein [Bernardetiaceae bacterium]